MDSSPLFGANGNMQSDDFKCSLCEKKFFSVASIYHHKLGPICDLCEFEHQEECHALKRQPLEESQFLIFPCPNISSGCNVQLKRGEVEDHETTCQYRKISCPVHDCTWKGCGPNLNDHLENRHTGRIQELPVINFTKIPRNRIILTRSSNQLMMVTIKCESPGRFSCMVMVNGISVDCDAYRYQLELSGANRTNSVSLRRDRLEDFVTIDQNLADLDKALVIEIPVIRTLLKDSETVLGRFVITKKSKYEVADSRQECFDDNVLAELECSVCQSYMVAPIMLCTRGHSYCQKCTDRMDVCPTCRGPFRGGRNYTLENLTTCVKYPCMNREAGCLVVCSGEKIKQHEKECAVSWAPCFLGCPSHLVVNVFTHMKEEHQEKLIVPGVETILDVTNTHFLMNFSAVYFGNDVFRCVVWYRGGHMRFSMEQFGVNRSNYIFEVELFSPVDPLRRIRKAEKCSPLGRHVDCVELSAKEVKKYISANEIFFRVHLKKISSE